MSEPDSNGARIGASGGRGLALAILAGGLLMIWFGAVAPYRKALESTKAELGAARVQLNLVRRLASPENPGGAIDAHLLLPGPTESAAAAALQQLAGEIALQAGAMILSFELLAAPDEAAPLKALTGRVRMTGDTGALRALLHALESHRPLLRLDNLFIRARSERDTIPGGHLDIQLDITGYRPPPQART